MRFLVVPPSVEVPAHLDSMSAARAAARGPRLEAAELDEEDEVAAAAVEAERLRLRPSCAVRVRRSIVLKGGACEGSRRRDREHTCTCASDGKPFCPLAEARGSGQDGLHSMDSRSFQFKRMDMVNGQL